MPHQLICTLIDTMEFSMWKDEKMSLSPTYPANFWLIWLWVAQGFSQLGKMRSVKGIGDSFASAFFALLFVIVGPQECESATGLWYTHSRH